MYCHGLKIFLMLILCLISSGYSVAFAKGEKSVYDFLDGNGFNGKNGFRVCSIENGSIVKNINPDVPNLLIMLKNVAVTEGAVEPSDYTIRLANGSSFPSQTIVISVGKTGNGYVQYLKEKKVFLKAVDLYGFCVTAFNKSKILIKST
jgi:hypothetical protein